MAFFSAFEKVWSRTVRFICTVLLAAIFIMFILNVIVRFVPVYNFTETDDWIQVCLIWMIFLGAAELVRTRSHFMVDIASARVTSPAIQKTLRVIVFAVEFTMYSLICWYGTVWVMRSDAYMQSIDWLEVRWVYLALPVSAFFMAFFALVQFFRDLKEDERKLPED